MLKGARLKARMTREEAAFRLHVAVRTLYGYEKGHRIPPPEVVCSMANVYDNDHILNWYCLNKCPIGERNIPCGVS